MLYRELAPVSDSAWREMEERLMEVFTTYLSGRKVVSVEGPKGFDFTAITEGRLGNVAEDGDVMYGDYNVIPLRETRVEFEMSRWELDNILRGAKDVDYEPLEKAAEKIALYEENSIYKKIIDSSENETITFGSNEESIMDSISKGVVKLKESYQNAPFSLVVGEKAYNKILSSSSSYPLEKRIEKIIGGEIVYSHAVNGAILVPFNHDDLELTIGKDLSLGYQASDIKNVRFFISESFAFRVLDPSIIVNFKL